MIYIIEGNTGSGKTTYANSLEGFEIHKHDLDYLQQIKDELSTIKSDVAFDRLFGSAWFDKTYEEILELNEYLKSVPDLICYKFIVDEELSLERYIEKWKKNMKREMYEEEKVMIQQMIHKQYIGFKKLFTIMDVFISKEVEK